MTRDGRHPAALRIILAFAAVYIIWGSTYLAIRFAVATLPPFLMAGVRFAMAGAVLSAVAIARGAARPTKANWIAVAIVGLLLFPAGNGVVVWSETRVDSGLAALLVATEPFWIVLMAWMRDGRSARPRMLSIAGITAGFVGLVVLVGPSSLSGSHSIDHTAVLALLCAACAWALGSVYAQRAPLPGAPLLAAGLEMIIGGAALIVIGAATGEATHLDIAGVSPRSVLAFFYLVVFGSLVGFTAYSWLVGTVAPARLSTYAYVNPVIAVFLGWAFAGEAITSRIAIAAAIIVGAVVLITLDQSRGPARSTPAARPAPAPVPAPARRRRAS